MLILLNNILQKKYKIKNILFKTFYSKALFKTELYTLNSAFLPNVKLLGHKTNWDRLQ